MAPPSRDGQNEMQPNGYTSGHSRNLFDAPPSTMAAQLINNLATSSKPSREPEQDELKRLMSEVSELENSPELLTDIKVKLAHKHKLIYVFARAVLERLCNDDPFINITQLVPQASEALDIFISAIREAPNVLEYLLPSCKAIQSRGQEPLWIWLFPRVLTLLGRQGCDALTGKIQEFFGVCFQVVSRSPKLWNLNFEFFTYLKGCIKGIFPPRTRCIIKTYVFQSFRFISRILLLFPRAI
jgi:serine/threonine-protein kinase ATR